MDKWIFFSRPLNGEDPIIDRFDKITSEITKNIQGENISENEYTEGTELIGSLKIAYEIYISDPKK